MGCSCAIDNDYGDECVDLYSDSEPVARKEHKCSECNRVIAKGEKYELAKYLYDGEWNTNKTCADCLSVRRAMFCSYPFGAIWVAIWEAFQEHPELPSSDCMMLMTKSGRDKFCDLLEKVWNED